MCNYRRGMDLLTTYTHDPELQAFTALSLISTIHKSPHHPLSLSSLSSPSVSWQRLLTVEILQLHALIFYLHRWPCRIQLSGWRLFHTDLLVVSSQTDFQITGSKVMLRSMVSRAVCLGVKYSFGAYDQILIIV
jgi:hypothetical protein